MPRTPKQIQMQHPAPRMTEPMLEAINAQARDICRLADFVEQHAGIPIDQLQDNEQQSLVLPKLECEVVEGDE